MEKDYLPSEKYSREEIESMKVPYAMQDACVDQIMDYRLCVHSSKYSFMPLFNRFGPCRELYERWIICQSNREFEIKERRRSSIELIEEGAKRKSM